MTRNRESVLGGSSDLPAGRNTEPLLEVTKLFVSFPSEAGVVAAVRGLSYRVMPGEVLGIVGESGSGKSVSSLAVMGLLPRQAKIGGSIRFEGKELLGAGDRELSQIRGDRIAMIFQDPLSALTPVYTVGDQIAESLRIHNSISRRAALDRAAELLDLVGISEPKRRAASFPHEFSGGMRQRAMIAMAIANQPDLIIADEPTTALDVTIQAQILEVLQKAREITGAAIVLITHDLGVVAGFADRVTVMYAGKPVETGLVDDVFYRPRMPYTLGLLGSLPRLDAGNRAPLTPIEGEPPSLVDLPPGCPFSPRCPMRVEICEQAEPEFTCLHGSGTTHLAACHRASEIEERNLGGSDIFPPARIGAPIAADIARDRRAAVLEVAEMVKTYPLVKGSVLRRRVGSIQAVAGISFDIRVGETLGLVGESGCGKTTTILEILNLVTPESGRIVVLGRDTSRISEAERFRIRKDLSVVFQDPLASLDPRLPVADILAEPMQAHGMPVSERITRINELLRIVGLGPEHASRYPQEFSGGQRQRIGIARALALNPQLLILDEPVSALDVSIRAGVINLLQRLKHELGLSYLFVAHDLSVVRYVADRVGVMYLGSIVEIGEAGQVFDSPVHPYTQALLSAIPLPDPRKERSRRRIILCGDVPSPADPPSGCRFRTRCQKFANELDDEKRRKCIREQPILLPTAPDADHASACHYVASSTTVPG